MANEFGFPFTPYPIQVDFMKALHEVLNEKKIGLFESPTGTGKSLSIICGALSWLREFQGKEKSGLSQQSSKLDEELKRVEGEASASGDWVAIHHTKKGLLSEKERVNQLMDIVSKFEKRTAYLAERRLRGSREKKKLPTHLNRKRKVNDGDGPEDGEKLADEDIVDYNSDEDMESGVEEEKEAEPQVKPKIFYCSRTHSQLTQFVNEIKKTEFAKSLRLVTLGSRANLCVNPAVNKGKNVSVLNDRCMELQKKTAKGQKCEYLNGAGMAELRDDVLGEVHDIEEVAAVGRLTKSCPYYANRLAIPEAEIVVLPYNVLLHSKTRKSYGIDLKDSVILVDEAHNLLETIGSVHSNEVNSDQLSECASQLALYLAKYKSRLNPKNLLHIKQLIFLVNSIVAFLNKDVSQKETSHQMLTVLDFILASQTDNLNLFKLLNYCEKSQLARKLFGFSTSSVYRKLRTANHPVTALDGNDHKTGQEAASHNGEQEINEPMNSAKATGASAFLNRMKQSSDTKKMKKAKMTSGKTSGAQSKCAIISEAHPTRPEDNTLGKGALSASEDEPPKPSSPLYNIIEFVKSLTNPSADGRVLVTRAPKMAPGASSAPASLKYLLLNPSNQFKEVVDECRSLILAGGTMKPFEEFTDLLFKPIGVERSRISTFSCGHVIPDNNLLALTLSRGPASGASLLDFTFANRMKAQVIDETGRVLLNLASIVPDGIVVFFASYDYEQKVYSHWERSGLIKQLEAKGKRVFREPRKANQVNQTLIDYSRTIRVTKTTTKGGAFLFSVVGGKMSEGINFSDGLGRCVVMVGLPYGNLYSPELKEKMTYLDREQGQGKGRFYYENLCMKAVNQSIGRAIRHQNDYSVIVLLDQRYSARKDIQDALPRWIGSRLQTHPQFAPAFAAVRQFFANKN